MDASNPVCPQCGGANFVYPKNSNGKVDYSRVIPCTCIQQSDSIIKQQRLLDHSRLGKLRDLVFDNYRVDFYSGDNTSVNTITRKAFDTALEFAIKPTGVLILSGPSGSGKTHLAAAITNKLIQSDNLVIYVSTPDLLDELRPNPANNIPDLFEQIKNIPVLLLDDFGIQNYSPWAKEKIDQLITFRINQNLPFVICTDIDLNDMDERLKTRLGDPRHSTIISFSGIQENTTTWPESLSLQKKMTFSSFDHDRVNLNTEARDNLRRAFKLAFDYAKAPEGWLILQGDTGCGKTHLASAIVNYRYDNRLPALFSVVPELLDHLRSTFTPDSPVSYDNIFQHIKTAPFLVLDDFGEHATTPWAREKLYQIISYRYNAQLPTVITTRVALDEFEAPVSSRFIDHQFSLVFNIIAPDYRGDSIKRKPSPPMLRKNHRR